MDDTAFSFSWPATLALSLVAAFVVKYLLVKISGFSVHIFLKSFTTSIEVQCREGGATNVVVQWLNHLIKCNCNGKLRHFCVGGDSIKKQRMNYVMEKLDQIGENTGDIIKQLDPVQSNRSVYFFYKRTLISVTRKVIPELRSFHVPTEMYTITAYVTRNKQVLIDMLEEARKNFEKKPTEQINYYKVRHLAGHFCSWQLARQFKPRALSTIVLKDGVTNAIQKDLKEFLESREWYKERGIPYRRGYLLYGPPGCGKTSFVKAIAGEVGYDIHEVQLSNRQLTDDSLSGLMSTFSSKAILLLEDIDAVFVPRTQDEANSGPLDGLSGLLKIRESKGSLSFSGLLNAIDGVGSEEDYIVFMTTNQIEKLDSALIRPGRIDMRQLIDYPDEKQIVAFFNIFYPGCADGVAETFAEAVTNLKCSPSVAQIQGIFLQHKHAPEDNLKDVDTLVEVCKSNKELGHIYL